MRVSALSHASIRLIKHLDAWNNVLSMRAAPYLKLEVWETENTHLIFKASDVGLSELGYMIENHILQLGLLQKFSCYPNLTLLSPVKLISMQRHKNNGKLP